MLLVRFLPALLLLACTACAPGAPGPDRVFVSNEQANVVHVLDGTTGRSEGALKTGRRPRGLAVSPDGSILFVAASESDRIELWDTRTLRHLRDFTHISDPERIALNPDGTRLYTASEDTSGAIEIDVTTGHVLRTIRVGPEPEGIGVSPDGRTIAVTSEVASVVHLVSARSGRRDVPVDTRPRDVIFRGRELWVSSELRGTIRIFHLPDASPLATIDLSAAQPDREFVQAVEMKASRNGQRMYVALGRGDAVAEIDADRRRVLRVFPSGHRTWGIALSPDGKRLYAAAGLSGDLTIVDLATGRTARTVALGGKPWTVLAVNR